MAGFVSRNESSDRLLGGGGSYREPFLFKGRPLSAVSPALTLDTGLRRYDGGKTSALASVLSRRGNGGGGPMGHPPIPTPLDSRFHGNDGGLVKAT